MRQIINSAQCVGENEMFTMMKMAMQNIVQTANRYTILTLPGLHALEWILPTGFLKYGEHPSEVAQRKLQKET